MGLGKKTIDDQNYCGKKVLVRCDFNVPMKDGVITNENRINAALPTIQKLVNDGAKVILCSHLGKPKNGPEAKFSLAPVAVALSAKLGKTVVFADDDTVVGDNAKAAVEHAKKNDFNVVIIDTAGRLHIDEDMMAELIEIKEATDVFQTILVVDAMTGQDAVNVAGTFDEKIGIDGVVITKLDGDTRGGAALSIRAVTGKPILYAGMGEKLSDLEQFYPERMASRILGMGDVLSMIEKAQENIDEEQAKKLEQKMRKNEFDFEMYLDSMSQMKKMGGLSSVMGMMPGMGIGGGKMPDIDTDEAEKGMARTEAIIYSMTPEERRNPKLLNPSRKARIARGAGVDVSEVNRLVKQFEQTKKFMKQMPGMMGGKKGRRGGGGLGGLFKGLPF